MSTVVLDASAVIALLRDEPGADLVRRALETPDVATPTVALLSSVNLTEVMQQLGPDLPDIIGGDRPIISVVPYTEAQAHAAAALHATTRSAGLSLGDRACLALAQTSDLPALTGDHAWATVDVGVDVQLIR